MADETSLFQSYLGRLLYNKCMQKVAMPKHLQGILWTKKSENLDIGNDRILIIHHVLRYGTISDIAWLLKTYSRKELVAIFLTKPIAVYSPAALHFAKNTVLNIPEEVVHEQQYIQSFL